MCNIVECVFVRRVALWRSVFGVVDMGDEFLNCAVTLIEASADFRPTEDRRQLQVSELLFEGGEVCIALERDGREASMTAAFASRRMAASDLSNVVKKAGTESSTLRLSATRISKQSSSSPAAEMTCFSTAPIEMTWFSALQMARCTRQESRLFWTASFSDPQCCSP